MKYSYKGLNVNYACIGQGKRVVLLHGWGGSGVWADYLQRLAVLGWQIFVLDLPGFGGSDTPEEVVDSFWYAELIRDFCKELEIDKPVLMGHSLGGKIAVICQAKYKLASRLILVASAGYKRFYIGVALRILLAKIGKLVLSVTGKFGKNIMRRTGLLKALGSADYVASGKMMKSFRRIIGEDIRGLFRDVDVPALLIWGDRDRETPLIDGVQMQRAIPDAELKIIKGANHFPFMTNSEVFYEIVKDA